MNNKRFNLKLGIFYDGEDILTDKQVLNILNGYDDSMNKCLKELYCKDRILEENNIPIECCDEND